LALVRRRQAGNDLSGHNATLTVLFPLVDVTEVLIVRPSRSCAAFLFWENDGRSHSEGIGLQALSPCPPDWPPTMEGFFLSITSKYVGGQSNAVLGISLQEFPPHCTDGLAITDDHPSAATAFRQHNSAPRDADHFSTN
jgi:hypothetical protein